ncbi:hypothetical protein BDN70DRAFT_201304 [Pholiota conissans]|uniref:Uncharacterized protein n=1 Tax=Pholiota conissans TaxID=109636 RepID=A0A9P5YVM3_9AGAR|nr:hypothetical protein BDN70DRAFT_201304 [Pholiota conissans]
MRVIPAKSVNHPNSYRMLKFHKMMLPAMRMIEIEASLRAENFHDHLLSFKIEIDPGNSSLS